MKWDKIYTRWNTVLSCNSFSEYCDIDKALACLVLLSYLQKMSLLLSSIQPWVCRASANCLWSRMIYWWDIDECKNHNQHWQTSPWPWILVSKCWAFICSTAEKIQLYICIIFLRFPKIEQQQNFSKSRTQRCKKPESLTKLCKIKSIKYISQSRDHVHGEVHGFLSTTSNVQVCFNIAFHHFRLSS